MGLNISKIFLDNLHPAKSKFIKLAKNLRVKLLKYFSESSNCLLQTFPLYLVLAGPYWKRVPMGLTRGLLCCSWEVMPFSLDIHLKEKYMNFICKTVKSHSFFGYSWVSSLSTASGLVSLSMFWEIPGKGHCKSMCCGGTQGSYFPWGGGKGSGK